MAFHFPLQVVLHFRESVEHQEELRLRAANQRAARVRRLLEQAEQATLELKSAQAKELGAGTTAAELRFAMQCEDELQRHCRDLRQQLEALQQACERQREVFRQAKRARETLESVRQQQLQLYHKEAARREQRRVDDLFLMRREYMARG